MGIKYLLPVLLTGFLAFSCREIEDPFQLPDVEDGDYYPLEPGKYWIYEVDSIIFDKNAPKPVDTAYYWVKEVVADTFFDLGQMLWYRIERYEKPRPADSVTWTIRQDLAATIDENQALRLENDLTFIKMLFPITPFEKWDGNSHFNPGIIVTVSGESIEMFKGWDYQVISAGVPDTIGGVAYSEVSTIRNADSENLIELRYAQEKYARDAGLVERELRILDTQQIDEFIPWEEKAEKGFILRQRLVESN